MIAVFGLTGTGRVSAVAIGAGLGLAASSRLQLLPAVFVLLAAATWLRGARVGILAAALASVFIVPLALANVRWFGTVLGAAPLLEALAPVDPRDVENVQPAMGRRRGACCSLRTAAC